MYRVIYLPNARPRRPARRIFALAALCFTLMLSACVGAPEAFLLPTPTPPIEEAPTAIAPVREQPTRQHAPGAAITSEETPTDPAEDPEPDTAETDTAETDTPETDTPETDSPTESEIPDYLPVALTFAAAHTELIEYNNWDYLKSVAGVPTLSSLDPFEDRLEFMRDLGRAGALDGQALSAGFGRVRFMTHAETWGWDSTDLVWEASYLASGNAPYFVLRLRDNFDFDAFRALLEEREFSQSSVNTSFGPAQLYSHPLDIQQEWLRQSEFAILNTVIVESENLLVLSSSRETVVNILRAQQRGDTVATRRLGIVDTANALGTTGSAIIEARGCLPVDVAGLLLNLEGDETLDELVERLRLAEDVHPYTVLAIGYRTEPPHRPGSHNEAENSTQTSAETPVGVIVHHYPDAELAHLDLEARRSLAEGGVSQSNQIPYAEQFEVLDATVSEGEVGGNLVLTLRAIDRAPQFFFEMLYRTDMLFSACSGF